MEERRLNTWETLFRKALVIIDSAGEDILPPQDWTFGGGTVLMRRYRHRFSKDIDIFVPDPQYLGYLSPRLNDTVDALANRYIEQADFLKLYFPEGEIDFVVSQPLTPTPAAMEEIAGRTVQVETSVEIIAKKIYHRGAGFTARDILDFALIAEKEPDAVAEIAHILQMRREVIFERLRADDANLRRSFAALEVLDYRRTYDECAARVTAALRAAG